MTRFKMLMLTSTVRCWLSHLLLVRMMRWPICHIFCYRALSFVFQHSLLILKCHTTSKYHSAWSPCITSWAQRSNRYRKLRMRIILRSYHQNLTISSARTCLRVFHSWAISFTLRKKVQREKNLQSWSSIHGCQTIQKTSIWTTSRLILMMIMMTTRRMHGPRRKSAPNHLFFNRVSPFRCSHGSDK